MKKIRYGVNEMIRKLKRFYRLHVQKDVFTVEVTRWFKDKGDETLRLDYSSLNEKSVVFDLGGYKGNFTADIHKKYGCTVYLFEPHPSFYQMCVERFKNNEKIVPLNFGVSDYSGIFELSDSMDGSSFFNKSHKDKGAVRCEIREFFEVIRDLGVEHIDLMKINIEGSEFPLLEHIANKNMLRIVDEYQIQFHRSIDDAERRRNVITDALAKTHIRTWCYTFVWENWRIK